MKVGRHMAQQTARVLVEGNVVRHQRKSGKFTGDGGSPVEYDYIEARVVTPAFDTADVRFPSNGTIAVPPADELVRLYCEARASMGTLKLTVEAVETALLPVGAGT